jgi:16S rRNA pseudouridine516 synthase
MIEECKKGVILPPEKKALEEMAAPCSLEFLSEEECLITLTEGKFHEVKRIFMHFGNRVAALKRIKFGPYSLPPDLAEGKYLQKDSVLF